MVKAGTSPNVRDTVNIKSSAYVDGGRRYDIYASLCELGQIGLKSVKVCFSRQSPRGAKDKFKETPALLHSHSWQYQRPGSEAQ